MKSWTGFVLVVGIFALFQDGSCAEGRSCKKGGGRYVSMANTELGNGLENVKSVQKCFDLLQNDLEPEQDCMDKKVGRCACTSSTLSSDGGSPNNDFYTTFKEFKEARKNLWMDSHEFYSMDAERFQGNTHLTYSCTK